MNVTDNQSFNYDRELERISNLINDHAKGLRQFLDVMENGSGRKKEWDLGSTQKSKKKKRNMKS